MSDRGFAAQLAEDLSPEDLRHVLTVFSADLLRLTAALGDATAAGDAAAFRRAAHGLAGAAGAVGAEALEAACRRAMARTDQGEPALEAARAEIEALAAGARDDLATFVEGLGDGQQ